MGREEREGTCEAAGVNLSHVVAGGSSTAALRPHAAIVRAECQGLKRQPS